MWVNVYVFKHCGKGTDKVGHFFTGCSEKVWPIEYTQEVLGACNKNKLSCFSNVWRKHSCNYFNFIVVKYAIKKSAEKKVYIYTIIVVKTLIFLILVLTTLSKYLLSTNLGLNFINDSWCLSHHANFPSDSHRSALLKISSAILHAQLGTHTSFCGNI